MPNQHEKRRDYERIARELIRALRGKRSCAELSRRAGYRSNVVHRWEAGQCWPTAADVLRLHARLRPHAQPWLEGFFYVKPDWAEGLAPCSPEEVATFLQRLRGKTPIVRVAALAQRNRYTVARWFDGSSEPRLPDFLRLVDVTSRRLLDLIAALEDPQHLPSLRRDWARHQLARKAAYELPWSHGVLRALELRSLPRGVAAQELFIARTLGIELEKVRAALSVLEVTAQLTKTRGGFRVPQVVRTDTAQDPVRAQELKVAWTSTALDRLRQGVPGRYGWSLFSVSRADLARLHDLHMQYVRAMQEVIASSAPSECVGLYCAQLLDLSSVAPRAGSDGGHRP